MKDLIYKELFETITQLKQLLNQTAETSADQGVATMLQFQALRLLSEMSSMTNNELADQLHISPSSAAQLTERLVKAELIERNRDTEDRRAVKLALTSQGKAELKTLKEKMYQRMQTVFSCLSTEDIQEFIRIHKKLIYNLTIVCKK